VLLSDFDLGSDGLLADHADKVAKRKGKGARVIVVSGHDPESIREALSDLPDLILSKPVRAAELRSALMASMIGD
jgi:DNA-binding NarL/FixJ family response regulator